MQRKRMHICVSVVTLFLASGASTASAGTIRIGHAESNGLSAGRSQPGENGNAGGLGSGAPTAVQDSSTALTKDQDVGGYGQLSPTGVVGGLLAAGRSQPGENGNAGGLGSGAPTAVQDSSTALTKDQDVGGYGQLSPTGVVGGVLAFLILGLAGTAHAIRSCRGVAASRWVRYFTPQLRSLLPRYLASTACPKPARQGGWA